MSSEPTDLAPIEAHPSLSMVDGPDPATAMAYAQTLARQLTTIVAGATTKIQGRDHVNIEGWQSLAAATGHTCEIEWSRPMDRDEQTGKRAWEARAVARDQSGRVVATAESMADPAEGAKWGRHDYSVRGMAQTRAMSRALAARMRYVVRLGGLEGTPAEDMPDVGEQNPRDVARARYKILRDTVGIPADVLAEVMPANPDDLADDGVALRLAFAAGAVSATQEQDVVEGEIVDDPAPESGGAISEKDRRGLEAHAREHGLDHDALKEMARELFNVESTKLIPADRVDELRAEIIARVEAEAA